MLPVFSSPLVTVYHTGNEVSILNEKIFVKSAIVYKKFTKKFCEICNKTGRFCHYIRMPFFASPQRKIHLRRVVQNLRVIHVQIRGQPLQHEPQKLLRRHGEQVGIAVRYADGAGDGRVGGEAAEAVHGPVQDHRREQADAQPLLHHGEDCVVVLNAVAHLGDDAQRPKGVEHGADAALLHVDQRLALEQREGDAVIGSERVILGEDRHELVPQERDVGQIADHLGIDKGEVDHARADPLGEGGVVAHVEHKMRPGIAVAEFAHEAGEHMLGHAGEGADADLAGLDAAQLPHPVGEVAMVGDQLADERIELLAVGGQADAGAGADQQLQREFVLQRADHLADGGLRIAEGLGGPGEAAQLHDAAERDIAGHDHYLRGRFGYLHHSTFMRDLQGRNLQKHP